MQRGLWDRPLGGAVDDTKTIMDKEEKDGRGGALPGAKKDGRGGALPGAKKDGRAGTRPEVKKDGRGGARPGAGRPPGDSRLYTFRASGEMAEVIGRQKSKTDFIRSCISREIRRAAGEAVCPERTAAGGVRAATDAGESTRAVPEASAGTVPATYAGESTRAVPEASVGAIPAARPEYNSHAVPATSVRGLRLPFFDLGIRAGFPIPLDNDEKARDIELLRLLCPHPEASYLIRVAGDSMIDAGIDDGDIIIVDKSRRNPAPSEVAVCELNGEYTLKRFEKDGDGSGWLVPANPAYPRIRINEGDSFSVWGTVSYIIHKPRA